MCVYVCVCAVCGVCCVCGVFVLCVCDVYCVLCTCGVYVVCVVCVVCCVCVVRCVGLVCVCVKTLTPPQPVLRYPVSSLSCRPFTFIQLEILRLCQFPLWYSVPLLLRRRKEGKASPRRRNVERNQVRPWFKRS